MVDRFLGEEMKLKVSKEYFRKLKNFLKSKLNGGNFKESILGQCCFYNIQQHLLFGESVSCRL